MPPARSNRRQPSATSQGENDQIDPTLHEAGQQGQSPSPQPLPHPFTLGSLAEAESNEDQLNSSLPIADPLTDFARQVVESELQDEDDEFRPDQEPNDHQNDILAAVVVAQAMELGDEELRKPDGDGSEQGSGGEETETPATGNKRGRGQGNASSASTAAAAKRKRGNMNGGLVAEESRDLARMKKDSHKEVERKRRDNINEGIVQIGRLVPGCSEKLGKGQILKQAAQYLSELTGKDGAAVIEKARNENSQQAQQKLQADLAEAQQQLTDEHARSITLETSWREAEDRAAASQFELERVKKELEDAKMQLLENRR